MKNLIRVFYRFEFSYEVFDYGFDITDEIFKKYDLEIKEMENLFVNGVAFEKDVIIQKSTETVPELYQIYFENGNSDNFQNDIILNSSVVYPQDAVDAIILDENKNLSTDQADILI